MNTVAKVFRESTVERQESTFMWPSKKKPAGREDPVCCSRPEKNTGDPQERWYRPKDRTVFLELLFQKCSPVYKGTREADPWQGQCFIKPSFSRRPEMVSAEPWRPDLHAVGWQGSTEMAPAQHPVCRVGPKQAIDV